MMIMKLGDDNQLLILDGSQGLLNAEQLKILATMCETNGFILRSLENQRLGLFVPVSQKDSIQADLTQIGFMVKTYDQPVIQSCIGSKCEHHEQDALKDAMTLEQELDESSKIFKIGMNGCSQSCIYSHTQDISLIADGSGYRMSIGGKNALFPEFAALYKEGLAVADLAPTIQDLTLKYIQLREPDETLQGVVERLGIVAFEDQLQTESLETFEEVAIETTPAIEDEIPLEEPIEEISMEAETEEPLLEEEVSEDDPVDTLSEDLPQEMPLAEPATEEASLDMEEDFDVVKEESLDPETQALEETQEDEVSTPILEDDWSNTSEEPTEIHSADSAQGISDEEQVERAIEDSIQEQREIEAGNTPDVNEEERQNVLSMVGEERKSTQLIETLGDEIIVTLASGSRVSIDKEKLLASGGSREIQMDGETFQVSLDDDGSCHIELDGIKIIRQAA
jgi:hypothetical protein